MSLGSGGDGILVIKCPGIPDKEKEGLTCCCNCHHLCYISAETWNATCSTLKLRAPQSTSYLGFPTSVNGTSIYSGDCARALASFLIYFPPSSPYPVDNQD